MSKCPVKKTYTEEAQQMDTAAMKARLNSDAKKCAEFRKQMGLGEKSFVNAANITREIGLSFSEYYLPSDAAAAENFFNKNYKKVLGLRFDQFQWVKSAARKLPDKCKKLADVYPALQMEFFAAGLLERPERDGQQQSHATTAAQAFFVQLNTARTKLNHICKSSADWTPQIRTEIKKHVDEHQKWLDGVREEVLAKEAKSAD